MPHNPDPDEDVLMDYGIARQKMVRVFSRDGVIDAQEREALAAFDRPNQAHAARYHVRRVFESLMRNGLTRRTGDAAKAIGLAVVIGDDRYPVNVVPFPEQGDGHRAA
jgi:hypothetical protein